MTATQAPEMTEGLAADWVAMFGHIDLPTSGDGCWLWPGARDRDGYGVKTVEGRQWRVNRLSFKLATGSDPGELLVRHSCDTPPCFRPSHLLPGTNQDNMDDKVSRGRSRNQYAAATRCIYGHPFAPENTYINPASGSRQCRTCRRELNRLEKKLAAVPADVRRVLRELFRQCMGQQSTWGDSDHSDVDVIVAALPGHQATRYAAQFYGIPTAPVAKAETDAAARAGQCSWAHIAIEELCEAVEAAALRDTASTRTEVLQLAAVCVQWVQAIDRRAGAR